MRRERPDKIWAHERSDGEIAIGAPKLGGTATKALSLVVLRRRRVWLSYVVGLVVLVCGRTCDVAVAVHSV